MHRLLVVAPTPDLRRSLHFALEAEGYLVTSQASIASRQLPGDFDCTVIDHHALDGDIERARSFCELFSPIVLLANSPDHPAASYAFRTVLKPTLGGALTAAIRQAIQQGSAVA
jgi:CheY-like chemotaxis protein